MDTKTYEALINELFCQSERTDERLGTWFECEACTVLSKIGITAVSTLYLIPGSSLFKEGFWDISSLGTLCRSIVEAYFVLRYIAVEHPENEERSFRRALWLFKMEDERLRMLQSTTPKSPSIPKVVDLKNSLKTEIQSSAIFANLSEKRQTRFLKGKNFMTKSNIDLCKDAGINPDLYRGIYKYLSSFTHASPFGLSTLYHHKAGDENTIESISLMVNVASGFLALTLRDFAMVFPDQKKLIPNAIANQIQKWESTFTGDISQLSKAPEGCRKKQ